MAGRLVLGDVPELAAGLSVERALERPGSAAVAALEHARRLGAREHAGVCGRQPRHLRELQLAVLTVAETLAGKLPALAQVTAAPDAGAVPLAGGGGVDRARLAVVDRVVDRPPVTVWPADPPVPAGEVALHHEASLYRPTHQPATLRH